MKNVYALICEEWGGNNYTTEIICVYEKQEEAEFDKVEYQKAHVMADTAFYVREVEFQGKGK